jgi:hypothetical protein
MAVVCTAESEANEAMIVNQVLRNIKLDQDREDLATELYHNHIIMSLFKNRSDKLYGICYPSSGIYLDWYVLHITHSSCHSKPFHREDAKAIVTGEVSRHFKGFQHFVEAMAWMVLRGNKEAYQRVTSQIEDGSGTVSKTLPLDFPDDKYRFRHKAFVSGEVSGEENIVCLNYSSTLANQTSCRKCVHQWKCVHQLFKLSCQR